MQESSEKTVVESSTAADYASIGIPAKAPEEYTYAERRAELLQIVQQAGHPAALNQTELAERFGVSQQQISKDLDRLDEYVRGRLGRRRDLEVGSVLKRCITGALKEGNYDAARRAAVAYDEYLSRRLDTVEFVQRIERLEEIAEQGGRSP